MKENIIKAFFVFSTAALLAFFILPKKLKNNSPVNRTPIPEPSFNEQDLSINDKAHEALIVLKAYIAAWNNNEPDSILDELNNSVKKEFGLTAYWKGNVLAVKDQDGNDVLLNK